ncbi:TRAP transporter permease [Bacillus sonorensis]|uniref:Tripartite ATP-independent dicarboxylate transporter large subunit 2 n=2 Tax=Bacillus sonorensis TaxID=119858 RepID=M5PEM1_9BACI|nr:MULTISPECIES: TRAP transporter permease [Bacillus]TWK76014.1 Sialic acid TRAP transporter large permease protein SiaM [Bacillus paralicheniformis]ASB88552.1 Putative TRAP transporter large permease protein [Bacillus sonorensis]EME74762.1 tripartite ATP-independent dicarboxylate transporter large subunit 2 [Bacillus sonorensis L12]MBG9915622.1 C4-dicarboxylate ABC transporter [Bacillus sonorensis]MCY7856628.1 TRAP transporter permease [Bacillus sonorensis]
MAEQKEHGMSLSEKEQQELLEKYDPEAGTRKLAGWAGIIAFAGLLSFSLFQLYTAIFGVFPAQIQRSVHLGFALGLIFLLFPATKNLKAAGTCKVAWYDAVLAVLGAGVGVYWVINYETIVTGIGLITTVDFYVGLLAVLLVLEATRRAVGLPITIIAGLFLLYGLYGSSLPGFLSHNGLTLERLIQTMYFTTEGILGTPLAVSSTFIFLFILFGAFLVQTGVGQYFNDLAVAVAGRSTGGPAKVAIFSSALQGTISGSSVANVVTSGSFTIPMMKKLGYKKEFAGAVEASASTGGQLMPPIMGAAAFLMVEFIGGGITYWDIAKAAAIPAVLYFTGIWIMTHFEAKRLGLRGLRKEEMPNRKEVFKKIYLLLPIVAVVFLLMTGITVMHAALYSIVLAVIVGFFNKDTRMGVKGIIQALADGARMALSVAAATAAAGIIVGVVTKTGLGLKLANGLLDLAGGALLPSLFLTMIAALVLGMGSPTTANYVITSTIAAPALIMLSVPDLSAHLFVFYFGIVADITPPVALAAFAAAGVAGGEPIRTGVISAKLAVAAFIIPYVFVLSPELLLIDAHWYEIIWVIFTALAGMIAIGAGMIGYWMRKVFWFERILAALSGLLLIYPEGYTDMIGLGIFLLLFILQLIWKRDRSRPEEIPALKA